MEDKEILYNNEIYQLGKILGAGAFAKVYSCIYNNILYAMKVIDNDKIDNEILIHSQLHHMNILNLYRYFIISPQTFILLEYCSRGSLFDYIKKNKTLPEIAEIWIETTTATTEETL